MKNIGLKFGRLLVLSVEKRPDKSNKLRKYYKCVCDCGKIHLTRADAVLDKKTFSCGCQKNEKNKGKNFKHYMYKTRIYNIWSAMKQRCLNENCHCFKYYGSRNVSICPEWVDKKDGFKNFLEWAKKSGYSDNLTIDRVDVNGNYCPENCRWATTKQQARNKTNNHIVEYNGISLCLTEWAEYLGVNSGTLISGINRGRTIDFYYNKYKKGVIC